jgi:hypothetical protein
MATRACTHLTSCTQVLEFIPSPPDIVAQPRIHA